MCKCQKGEHYFEQIMLNTEKKCIMYHSTNILSEKITMWGDNPVLYMYKTPFKSVRVLLVLELPD